MKKSLYVSRPILNFEEIRKWARSQGFESILEDGDMHVTIAFSSKPIVWPKPKRTDFFNTTKNRVVKKLGDATVLTFPSKILHNRWQQFMDIGASWDFPSYISHVTITWDDDGLNLTNIKPFLGQLHFGKEKFAEIDDDWKEDIKELPLD